MQNSHIQIPKCLLKRFENENHELFYFDNNDYTEAAPIKKGHAKTLNTEYGYYSSDVEKVLNTNIETPLGRVLTAINNCDFNAKNIILPTDSEIIIRNYAYSLLCRSAQILETLKNESISFRLFIKDGQQQHDIAVIEGMQSAFNIGYFRDWHLAFVLNDTTKPFILPLYGVFSFNDGNRIYLHIPLTPKISASLICGNKYENYMANKCIPIIRIADEKQIFIINQIGCRYELLHNRGVCISSDKEYLKTIISSLVEI